MGLQACHDGQELLVGLLGFKDQILESLVHSCGVGVRMSYADFPHEASRVNAPRPEPIVVHNFLQVLSIQSCSWFQGASMPSRPIPAPLEAPHPGPDSGGRKGQAPGPPYHDAGSSLRKYP